MHSLATTLELKAEKLQGAGRSRLIPLNVPAVLTGFQLPTSRWPRSTCCSNNFLNRQNRL